MKLDEDNLSRSTSQTEKQSERGCVREIRTIALLQVTTYYNPFGQFRSLSQINS